MLRRQEEEREGRTADELRFSLFSFEKYGFHEVYVRF